MLTPWFVWFQNRYFILLTSASSAAVVGMFISQLSNDTNGKELKVTLENNNHGDNTKKKKQLCHAEKRDTIRNRSAPMNVAYHPHRDTDLLSRTTPPSVVLPSHAASVSDVGLSAVDVDDIDVDRLDSADLSSEADRILATLNLDILKSTTPTSPTIDEDDDGDGDGDGVSTRIEQEIDAIHRQYKLNTVEFARTRDIDFHAYLCMQKVVESIDGCMRTDTVCRRYVLVDTVCVYAYCNTP